MKKKKRLLCAVLLLISLLGGCVPEGENPPAQNEAETEQGTQEQTEDAKAYFGLAYYPNEVVNPVLSTTKINRLLTEVLYEGLFELDDAFQPQPVLCTTYTGDGTTYTFTIKSGVSFWSGEPVRASDVAYTYQKAMQTPDSPYYVRMQQVASVSAVSETEVQFVLRQPNINFVSLLDIPIFRQGSEAQAFSDGTGPYKPLEENGSVVLTPNTAWHAGRVSEPETISLVSIVRGDAVSYSIETGEVSLTRAERISANPVTYKGSVEIFRVPTTNMHYLGVNYGRAPYQLSGVRRALSAAVNRTHLAETQMQGFADAAVLPVNPQPQNMDALELTMGQDQELALNLLMQEGIYDSDGDGILDYALANGRRAPFAPEILVNAENTFKIAAVQQIIAEWELIGIRATIRTLPFEEYEQAIAKGDYDLYYAETTMTADFDIRPLFSSGGALNYGKYQNTLLDERIAAARSTAGEQVRQELYSTLLQEMPILPLAFSCDQIIVRDGLVENFTPAPYNAFSGIQNWRLNR